MTELDGSSFTQALHATASECSNYDLPKVVTQWQPLGFELAKPFNWQSTSSDLHMRRVYQWVEWGPIN